MRPTFSLLAAALLTSVAFLPTGAAQTQPEPPAPPPLSDVLTGHAKRDYEAARLLFDVGDYAGALARFLNAARVSNDPRLLWNAAACEMKLRHYAKALGLVRRYLDSQSPLITAAAARNARSFLEAAELLTVRLHVESSEADALVYVDGELMGAVPLGPSAALDLGRHEIVVKKEGFFDFNQTLTVTGSADLLVRAELRPLPRRAGAPGVMRADGPYPGAAASRRTWEGSAPIGPHSAQITAPGLRPVVPRIAVLEQQSGVVESTLDSGGIPTWVWIVGGSVLLAGAATFGYFILKPSEASSGGSAEGSIATVQLPLR